MFQHFILELFRIKLLSSIFRLCPSWPGVPVYSIQSRLYCMKYYMSEHNVHYVLHVSKHVYMTCHYVLHANYMFWHQVHHRGDRGYMGQGLDGTLQFSACSLNFFKIIFVLYMGINTTDIDKKFHWNLLSTFLVISKNLYFFLGGESRKMFKLK